MQTQSAISHLCRRITAKTLDKKIGCLRALSVSSNTCLHHCCNWLRSRPSKHKQYSVSRNQIALRRRISSSPTLSDFWGLKNANVTYFQEGSSPPLHDGLSLLDRYIFVKTLVNLYEDVSNGIILDTAYADSRPGEEYDPAVPVVVGIHDTPGTHSDVVSILSTFAKVGCRTIAPTFPGKCWK